MLRNSNRIRRSCKHSAPSGRPMTMYNLPHLYGTKDFLCPVAYGEIELCKEECMPKTNIRVTRKCMNCAQL